MLPRRWLQFRLTTVFVLMALLSAPLAWLGIKMRDAARQKAIRDIQTVAAIVPLADNVVWIRFHADHVEDRHLASVKYVPGTVHLTLTRGVVGRQLQLLADAHNLASLSAPHNTTDDDLAGIAGLTCLESLHLSNTQVTDEGLAHLTSLKSLQRINLLFTRCSEAGVVELQARLSNCQVIWEGNLD